MSSYEEFHLRCNVLLRTLSMICLGSCFSAHQGHYLFGFLGNPVRQFLRRQRYFAELWRTSSPGLLWFMTYD